MPVTDRNAPVGIFDSGVGGLTVARSIIDQLPDENMIYVGDTAHGPYGPLTIPEVRAHALAIGDDLVARGVKALVIACNTASSACLRDARERYDIPVIEVILPAVRRAVATTRSGRIGVIGTTATIGSGAYQDAFAAARDVEVSAVACPGFVDFVERGITSGREVLGKARTLVELRNDEWLVGERTQVDPLVGEGVVGGDRQQHRLTVDHRCADAVRIGRPRTYERHVQRPVTQRCQLLGCLHAGHLYLDVGASQPEPLKGAGQHAAQRCRNDVADFQPAHLAAAGAAGGGLGPVDLLQRNTRLRE